VLTTHGLLAYEWLAEQKFPGERSLEWQYTYWRERVGVLASDVHITPSAWMKTEYEDYFGIQKGHTVVIPYGIDEVSLDQCMQQKPTGLPNLSGCTVLTCVARLVPLKGHKHLLTALTKLVREFPHLRCLVVGDGPSDRDLQELSRTLGLDSFVFFLGRRSDVPAILGVTDVFVLPSIQEITPVAITEAQLAGVPVVATDVGGIPELIVNGQTGFLVPPESPDSIAEALRLLLHNPDLREQVALRAWTAARQERVWSRHYGRLMSAYLDAITGHRSHDKQ